MPWHFLIHAPKLGAGAVLGGAVGAFLAWPQTAHVFIGFGTEMVQYKTRLGVTSMDSGSALKVLFVAIVAGLLAGAAAAAILVRMGVLRSEDVKID